MAHHLATPSLAHICQARTATRLQVEADDFCGADLQNLRRQKVPYCADQAGNLTWIVHGGRITERLRTRMITDRIRVQGFCRPAGPSAARWPAFSHADCRALARWFRGSFRRAGALDSPHVKKPAAKVPARVLPCPESFLLRAVTGIARHRALVCRALP